MIINKFEVFESLIENESFDDYAAVNEAFAKHGIEMNEGVWSSFRNYVSKLVGGRISKLDVLLKKYHDNEIDYWKNWADAQTKYNEADLLSREAKSDPVERKKYDEQKDRVKRLQAQVESSRSSIEKSLLTQADKIIGSNQRMQDYWDTEKAKIDEKVARDSYEAAKKQADQSTLDMLYSQIEKKVEIARQKESSFNKKYSDVPQKDDRRSVTYDSFDRMVHSNMDDEHKLSIKVMLPDELEKLKTRVQKEIDQIKEKGLDKKDSFKKRISDLEDKIEFIDEVLAGSKEAVSSVKKDPEMVTPVANKELGKENVEDVVQQAVAVAAEDTSKPAPTVEEVSEVIDDTVKQFFVDAKEILEQEVGEIKPEHYVHIKNDLINLFGKILIYYKQTYSEEGRTYDVNAPGELIKLKIDVLTFANQLYVYKKDKGLLDVDLSEDQLKEQLSEFKKMVEKDK